MTSTFIKKLQKLEPTLYCIFSVCQHPSRRIDITKQASEVATGDNRIVAFVNKEDAVYVLAYYMVGRLKECNYDNTLTIPYLKEHFLKLREIINRKSAYLCNNTYVIKKCKVSELTTKYDVDNCRDEMDFSVFDGNELYPLGALDTKLY